MDWFAIFASGSISWLNLQVSQMEAYEWQTSEVLPAWASCAFGNVSSWQNHQALTELGGLASRWWGLPAWLVTYQSNLRIDKSIKHRQSAHRGISRKANRTQSLLSNFWILTASKFSKGNNRRHFSGRVYFDEADWPPWTTSIFHDLVSVGKKLNKWTGGKLCSSVIWA